ncbi:MAG: transglycosylase SLT domain-containing protein [Alphaproteobacteria bacterium]|nr:transglycosylase SLT domain-containing protein [Alphaproteobacteria bacterium]
MDLVTLLAGCALSFNTATADTGISRPPCRPEPSWAITDSAVAWPANGRSPDVEWWSPLIAEASRRFAISEELIRKVMRVESRGDGTATSRKGAIGLMQVMPRTYAELRKRYSLGTDPYAPRDNIMAGVAYLREMLDRYGATGFLAAYNAGPGRYEEYLTSGRVLPDETMQYLATVGQLPDANAASDGVTTNPSLFVVPNNSSAIAPQSAAGNLFVPVSTIGSHP